MRSHELAYEKLGQELVRSQAAGATAAALSGKALREARLGAQSLKQALDASQVRGRGVYCHYVPRLPSASYYFQLLLASPVRV